VIDAGSALLEQRGDERDLAFLCDFGETPGSGAGNGLGEIKESVVFALAEILCLEELGEADHVRALCGGFIDHVNGVLQVLVWIGRAAHLHQADTEFLSGQSGGSSKNRSLAPEGARDDKLKNKNISSSVFQFMSLSFRIVKI
jgi:hypothetical protein